MAGCDRRRLLAFPGARTAAFRFLLPAVALALFFPAAAGAYREFRDNTAHDFVRFGFLGGGVCDECHAAGGTAGDTKRIFRWNFAGSDINMCADKCHGAAPAWPAEAVWTRVVSSYGGPPPAMSHAKIVSPYRCEYCHRHLPLTGGSAYADCLRCHTPSVGGIPFGLTGAGYDIGADIEVDKFMDGIGSDADAYATLSQHDIRYNASGNLATAADNECLKCHGAVAATEHPGGTDNTPLLVYPDDPDGTGALTAGTGIAKSANYANYQLFCLACHDGEADGVVDPQAVRFNGSAVPAVPPYEYPVSAGGPAAPPYPSTTPYFAYLDNENTFNTTNYFEVNGHGRNVGTIESPSSVLMNLTCLGQNGPQGCHTAHGSKNAYLIEDSGNLGTGVDTAAEMGAVCIACHSSTVMAGYTENNKFHYEWIGRLTHVGTDANAYVCWDPLPVGNNMATGVQTMSADAKILPFFSSAGANLRTGRQYSTRVFGSGTCNGSVITCITCHDPHGTSESYTRYTINPDYTQPCLAVNDLACVDHTQGMLRVFVRTWSYDDPLCKNCHLSQ